MALVCQPRQVQLNVVGPMMLEVAQQVVPQVQVQGCMQVQGCTQVWGKMPRDPHCRLDLVPCLGLEGAVQLADWGWA